MKSIAQGLERLDSEEAASALPMNHPGPLGTTVKTRKPRAKAPANETPAERFVRVGSARVNAAVLALELVGGLSSPSFEYTEPQMQMALKALWEASEDMAAKLRGRLEGPAPKRANPNRFHF